MKNSVGGMFCIIAAAILWGTTGTSQALAPVESAPQVIGALRLLVGGGALVVVSTMKRGWPFRGMPIRLAVGAGFFVALYQVAFFWGVSLTGVAVGTMVGIGSAPVFAGMIDALFMDRRPGRRWYAATVMALAGCTILLAGAGQLAVNALGVFLAAGAGLSYGMYTMFMKKLLVGRGADAVAAAVFSVGALLSIPFLIGADLNWVFRPAGLVVVIHLGLLATAVSYLLFCRGLESVQISTAVTLSLAEPATAGILGLLLLGERVGFQGGIGLLLILSGLVILTLPTRARNIGLMTTPVAITGEGGDNKNT